MKLLKVQEQIKEREKFLKVLEQSNTPLRIYNFVKDAKGKKIVNKVKDKFYGTRTVLINMELMNGFHKTFLAIESDGCFKYRSKKYIFDDKSKYYNFDARQWCYDFHESLSIPVVRKIDVINIKKGIEQSGVVQTEAAINPSVIDRFLKAKIAEGIMKGQQIDEWLKKIAFAVFITMGATIIHLLIFMFKTGMFSQIKLPT